MQASEKSFIIVRGRPSAVCGESSVEECLGVIDLMRFDAGLFVFFEWRAFTAWVWRREARFRRQESVTRRSARIDSSGVSGASSARSWSRWIAKSAGSSSAMTACEAVRPCLTAFCETTALPWRLRGPVDLWALRRLARTCFSVLITFIPFLK